MHVTIERKEEASGLFKKTTWYYVTATITFSEEEKAIIKKSKLTDKWAMVYKMEFPHKSGIIIDHGPEFKDLLKGPHVRRFESLSEANEWEHDLRSRQLPAMKSVIDGERETKSEGPSSFEL